MMTASFKQQQRDYLEERQAARARLAATMTTAETEDMPALRKRMLAVERQIKTATVEIAHHT